MGLIAGASAQTGAAAKASPEAQRWWAHVQFLADDSLEGRNTGSEGHKKAAAYVADRFKQAGLEPAGTSGYLQPVAFVSRKIVEAESSLALVRDGVAEPVELGPEAAISMRTPAAPEVEAPLVFAGYGLTIPEAQHDDFADIDVRGKIVVMITGGPDWRPRSAERPLSVRRRARGELEAGRRDRDRDDLQSAHDRRSLGSIDAGAAAARDVTRFQ